MTSGGARNRSGPQKDPNSLRSARGGFTLSALPAEGFAGKVPDLAHFLPVVTDRHAAIWADLWSTPQACAWSMESWRWQIVADLVEYRVRIDDPESPIGLTTSIRQLRDDLGLSAAGLKANGWAIADPIEVAGDDSEGPAAEGVVDMSSARSRLRK